MNNCDGEKYIFSVVGVWSQKKYDLIYHYANMFSTSMKNKWDCRVYIDCFCGSGFSKFKGSNRTIKASATLALGIKHPFDKYVFCDSDSKKLESLNRFTNDNCPDIDISYISSDVNESVADIIDAIPKPSKNFKVLSFCLLDPYKISNLKFETIIELSKHLYIDYLILIPSFMDANRNLTNLLNNDFLDNFLGTKSWRQEWKDNKNNYHNFGEFVVYFFNKQMQELNFIGLDKTEFVKISEVKRNCPLYHLAFYSKSPLGKKFWKESIISSTPQTSLDL